MATKKKKPSAPGRGLLGQQQKYGHPAANRNYNKPQRAARLPDAEEFYAAEIDNFTARSNDGAWGCCPFHDDRNPSFQMNLASGAYRCMSTNCGASGKSIVAFVAERDGLTTAEAIRFLEGWA